MADTLVEWDDSFLIGIEELDYEHKALIDDINKLHEELTKHDEESQVENVLGSIDARMRAHFALEERFMKDHGYEFFDEHKREHDQLLDWYTEYMLLFLHDGGATSSDPIEDTLRYWVANHIINSDKKMSLIVQE